MTEMLHSRKCWDRHMGVWVAEPKWFAATVAAIKAGTYAARSRADEDDPAYVLTSDGIAVIEMNGPISKGRSKFGGVSSVDLRGALREIGKNAEIKGALLHIDSPGGMAAGTYDAAADVSALNAQKPVYAHIDDLGASAAYWIASQARRVSAGPMSQVGSIGVYAVVEDTSQMYEMQGIKVHVVSTGPYKGAFVDGAPIQDEHLQDLRNEVERINEFFQADVSRGRAGKIGDMSSVTDGRTYFAKEARALGLLDSVDSLDGALAELRREIGQIARRESAQQRMDRSRRADLSRRMESA